MFGYLNYPNSCSVKNINIDIDIPIHIRFFMQMLNGCIRFSIFPLSGSILVLVKSVDYSTLSVSVYNKVVIQSSKVYFDD
jgi:hypothetical protein